MFPVTPHDWMNYHEFYFDGFEDEFVDLDDHDEDLDDAGHAEIMK